MNVFLENLLTLFLGIVFLDWIISGIVGVIIILVSAFLYVNNKCDMRISGSFILIIIVSALVSTRMLSVLEASSYTLAYEVFNNFSEVFVIMFGLLLAITGWNWIKEF